MKSVSIVGGVSNNEYIRKKISNYLIDEKIKIFFPIKEMLSDNAAMIAWSGINKNKSNEDIFFKANPRLEIKQIDSILN